MRVQRNGRRSILQLWDGERWTQRSRTFWRWAGRCGYTLYHWTAAFALIAGAIFAYVKFHLIEQVEALDCSLVAEHITPLENAGFEVLIAVRLRNVGTRPVHADLSGEATTIVTPVTLDPTVPSRSFVAQGFERLDSPTRYRRYGELKLAPGAEKTLSYAVVVPTSGLYHISFRVPVPVAAEESLTEGRPANVSEGRAASATDFDRTAYWSVSKFLRIPQQSAPPAQERSGQT